MNEFVNLSAFRKDNKLTQYDIADYLSTSRGFISMVESGRSQLSEDKVRKLLNSGDDMNWTTDSLIPHLRRIQVLSEYLSCQLKDFTLIGNTENSDSPFCLSYTEYESISLGHSPITEAIADRITYLYPQINREWLLNGKGPMIKQSSDQIYDSQTIIKKLEIIDQKLDSLLKAIDNFNAK